MSFSPLPSIFSQACSSVVENPLAFLHHVLQDLYGPYTGFMFPGPYHCFLELGLLGQLLQKCSPFETFRLKQIYYRSSINLHLYSVVLQSLENEGRDTSENNGSLDTAIIHHAEQIASDFIGSYQLYLQIYVFLCCRTCGTLSNFQYIAKCSKYNSSQRSCMLKSAAWTKCRCSF